MSHDAADAHTDADDGVQLVECGACGSMTECDDGAANRCQSCYALINDDGDVTDDDGEA